jgi:hypothetical protein
MASPVRQTDPALVSIALNPGSLARVRPSPNYVFSIYVDGTLVGSCPYATVAALLLAEGCHAVSVRMYAGFSDVVELDLAGGDQVELVCAIKPLMRNRFFKIIETKFLFIMIPLALVAFVYPDVVRFIEAHAKYEFLAVVFLFCIGVVVSLPKLFSRKPGAMVSLTQQAACRDGDSPDVTFAEFNRLVSAGACPFFLVLPPAEVDGGSSPDGPMRDPTVVNYPKALPLVLALAAVDTVCVLLWSRQWFPPKPSLMMLVVVAGNGLLIGLLFTLQIGILCAFKIGLALWLRHRSWKNDDGPRRI